MKKRCLAGLLALVLCLGLSPISALAGDYDVSIGYSKGDMTCMGDNVLGVWKRAMQWYDWTINLNRQDKDPAYLCLTPYDAIDLYTVDGKIIWGLVGDHWSMKDGIYTNWDKKYLQEPWFFEAYDSFNELVLSKRPAHTVDPSVTDTDKIRYWPFLDEREFTIEELAWAEWYSIQKGGEGIIALADYMDYTYDQWLAYRKSMSTEENELFRYEWWPKVAFFTRSAQGWCGIRDWDGSFSWNSKHIYNDWMVKEGYPYRFDTATGLSTSVNATTEPVQTPQVTVRPQPTVEPIVTPEPVQTTEPVTPVKPSDTQDDRQYFPDVTADKWYYEAVNNYAKCGILKGKSDGLFHPNDLVTGAEFAVIICRIGQAASHAYKGYGDPNCYWYSERLITNPKHWAERYIYGAEEPVQNEMTMPFHTSVERCDKAITRRDAAFAINELTLESQFPQYSQFINGHRETRVTDEQRAKADEKLLDTNKYMEDVLNLYALDIIHGDGTGHFNPTANITRAELCQILYNMGATTNWLGADE